ncbi:hypothetical protein XBKQ1_1320001 [Xenorhabdus bovienii str. kraussei Quebec]|uniref:Uncharacterized protein n=1 Tax=Xenorhabdus bovienii str. kraussei Quebec TaxID=1398203 RepID=A0A077PCZ8_XENBV|nr:hypothetical protein XBKQ1_1320001 [Xenorhabdus bovienii str. kraussei Quebec]
MLQKLFHYDTNFIGEITLNEKSHKLKNKFIYNTMQSYLMELILKCDSSNKVLFIVKQNL